MALERVPVDVILMVFRRLSPEDILRVRQVCRTFRDITQLRSLWHDVLVVHILECNLPVPGISSKEIHLLDACDLERHIFKAIRLRHNWRSPSPRSTTQREITSSMGCRTVMLHFTKGSARQYLISLFLNTAGGQRHFIIQCWDLAGNVPLCVASRTFSQGFGGIAFNQCDSKQVLAVQCPHLEIIAVDPVDGFRTSASFLQYTGRVHLLSGSRVLTQDGVGTLSFWSIEEPQRRFELHNPQNAQAENIMSVQCDGNLVLLVKQMSLEVYEIPELDSFTTILIQPIIQYRWPWRIDSVVLCPQGPRSTTDHPPRHRNVNILIRFASVYPWPINLIHHYELRANIFYSPNAPNTEHILPYHFPPTQRQTIGSPIRLFAVSDMVIGSHGTAMWFDSHTEDFYGHSDRGQRLAGKHMHVIEDSNQEAIESDQATSTTADSVFAIHEDDNWVRLAINEDEGQVAVGCSDGKILVFDYT
ncbi:hypothetical protein BDQ17DRAFT_1423891 [Cyathus striatus]|nr:hypothetical protein BDQ17DRAFT_1423891 [Cyathus striatus]